MPILHWEWGPYSAPKVPCSLGPKSGLRKALQLPPSNWLKLPEYPICHLVGEKG